MTQDEFQHRYYDFGTQDKGEAIAEANKANQEGIDGDRAVAVQMGDIGYCLMLGTSFDFMNEMDNSIRAAE